jgi:hypothetical protein
LCCKATNSFAPFFSLQLRCVPLLSWLSATQFFCPFFLFLFCPFFSSAFGFIFFCVATCEPIFTSITDILFYSKAVNILPLFTLAKQEQLNFYVVRQSRTHCIFFAPFFLFLFAPFFDYSKAVISVFIIVCSPSLVQVLRTLFFKNQVNNYSIFFAPFSFSFCPFFLF